MTVELVALDRHWAQEIEREGNASLAASCSNFDEVQPFVDEAVDAHIALYRRTEARAPWIAYLARQRDTRAFVGICSFKDVCRDGRVEIAYFTFPPYQRQGFGTAMARQLVALAFNHPDVREVVAHTRPRESASTRILRALRFVRSGRIDDPADGPVWRWTLAAGARVAARALVRADDGGKRTHHAVLATPTRFGVDCRLVGCSTFAMFNPVT